MKRGQDYAAKSQIEHPPSLRFGSASKNKQEDENREHSKSNGRAGALVYREVSFFGNTGFKG